MKSAEFRTWLTDKYSASSANTNYSFVKRVEEAYGNLDAAYDADKLASVIGNLAYGTADAKAGKDNPTKLSINGNPYIIANARSALRPYVQFREQEDASPGEAVVALAGKYLQEKKEGKQFELERNLQEALRDEIGQLEAGLEIIDGGIERSVESGFIDILARDAAGAIVAVELKRGDARRDAMGQLLGYMGDLMAEEPGTPVRGMLVAAEFDKACQSALAVVPSVTLKRYRFNFTFEDVEPVAASAAAITEDVSA